jgi:hypothetical protein
VQRRQCWPRPLLLHRLQATSAALSPQQVPRQRPPRSSAAASPRQIPGPRPPLTRISSPRSTGSRDFLRTRRRRFCASRTVRPSPSRSRSSAKSARQPGSIVASHPTFARSATSRAPADARTPSTWKAEATSTRRVYETTRSSVPSATASSSPRLTWNAISAGTSITR